MFASLLPGNLKPIAHLASAYSCACIASKVETISPGNLHVVSVICWLAKRLVTISAGVINGWLIKVDHQDDQVKDNMQQSLFYLT
jgi:hypothetical protein